MWSQACHMSLRIKKRKGTIAVRRMGVREVKTHWSEVLNQVREKGETIEVTRRGEVIARVIPVRASQHDSESVRATLTDIETLRAEISKAWPEGLSVQDVINDIRS
jgi:prevent-host-death family protein